jgi:hypothetical protein
MICDSSLVCQILSLKQDYKCVKNPLSTILALKQDYRCVKNPLSTKYGLKSILGGCWWFLMRYMEDRVILDTMIYHVRPPGTHPETFMSIYFDLAKLEVYVQNSVYWVHCVFLVFYFLFLTKILFTQTSIFKKRPLRHGWHFLCIKYTSNWFDRYMSLLCLSGCFWEIHEFVKKM